MSEQSTDSHVVFIAGRSGAGKTTVAAEMHAQLSRLDVRHCWIEGDNLDMAHPPPWEYKLAEKNLASMWANYRELGYHRLIYTNTVSILHSDPLARSMGDDPVVTGILLTATDATVRRRLAEREIGSELALHMNRSVTASEQLGLACPQWVHRVSTDSEPVADIAAAVLLLTGWAPE